MKPVLIEKNNAEQNFPSQHFAGDWGACSLPSWGSARLIFGLQQTQAQSRPVAAEAMASLNLSDELTLEILPGYSGLCTPFSSKTAYCIPQI